MTLAAVVVVVVDAVSEGAGASSFSALDWGTEKLKDGFELPFSLGLAPNKNAEFSEPEAWSPKLIPLPPPNLNPALESWDLVFFSSESSMDAPNVKVFDTLSFDAVDSDEELPSLTPPEAASEDKPPNLKPSDLEVKSEDPNVNPPVVELVSEKVPPNFRSAEVEFIELVPNLKPDELESVLLDWTPNDELKPEKEMRILVISLLLLNTKQLLWSLLTYGNIIARHFTFGLYFNSWFCWLAGHTLLVLCLILNTAHLTLPASLRFHELVPES